MPYLIGTQDPMPGAHHTSWKQEIDHRAGLTRLPVAALNHHLRAMALAVETTLWMGLKFQIRDQLLAEIVERHKKSPVCTEPLGVCEE